MTAANSDAIAGAGERNLVDVVWGTEAADRVALVEHTTGRCHRYEELRNAAERFAAGLVRRGLRPGETVAVVCDNGGEFVVSYHGTLLGGGVVLPLEPLGAADEWNAALSRCDTRYAVVTAAVWRKLSVQAVPESLRHIVVIGEGDPHAALGSVEVVGWDRMLAEGTPTATRSASAEGGDRTALLVSSSGTQGLPKQVVLTHRNLAANLVQIALVHKLRAEDVVLGLTPFRHIYGMQMAMNPTLRAGGTLVVVATPFTAEDLLEVVQRRRITVAYLVPSVLTELSRCENVERYDTSSLRLLFSGGAPLPPAVAKTCADILGVPVVQGYGMTEAGCTHAPPDGSPSPPGSIGLPLPGTQTRFIDPATGLDVDRGEPGETWVRGPQISPGYLQGPDTVVPLVDDDGWLRTGDIGCRDARGYVTITGRRKQLIKYKGHQVAPAELEAILLAHPNVADAVVVGIPDQDAGEIPKAFVVLSAPVALDEVSAYVAERVAPYKKIRRIEAVDSIPRSATGKVLRGALGPDAEGRAARIHGS